MVRRIGFKGFVVLIVAVCLFLPQVAFSQSPSVVQQLEAMAVRAQHGMDAAAAGDVSAMQAEYDEIHEAWEAFEDEVREQDPGAYVELETALDRVKGAAFAAETDAQTVGEAFDHLRDEAEEVAEHLEAGTGGTAAVPATPEEVMDALETAQMAVAEGDAEQAEAALEQAIVAWPSVEGAIAAKSQSAYATIETELGRARAALEAQPVDFAAASAALATLSTTLAPFVGAQTYTAFDAAAILLREGLEALLVVVALLAFLRRSGNEDKRSWIWVGAGAGLLVSVATAFVLQSVFSRIAAGQNREVIEGLTSLLAAGLLFYVSYWLHSKANLHAWQRYIDAQTTRALARGSMFGLAALSFLAVFREGAETAVFYLGMASSISAQELLLGLGLGAGLLVVGAILMLVVGVRLPLRIFFRVAGLLVYYLGFKFVGTGIHALQVAGVVPTTPIGFMREIPVLGIYPTWETMVPQILLLVGAVGMLLYLRNQERVAGTTMVSAST